MPRRLTPEERRAFHAAMKARPVHFVAGLGRGACGVRLGFKVNNTSDETAVTCPKCLTAMRKQS